MRLSRSFLPVLAAFLLVGCSEDEVESPTDTGVEDTLGDAGDATVDSTPDTSSDAADGSPDTTIVPDSEGDAAEAGVADAADAVVDGADAASDSADVAIDSADAAETSVDAPEASVDAAEVSVDAAEASVDAAETSVDAAETAVDAGPSGPTEVWVVRVGTGAAPLDTSSTATFIDRFALPGGALLGTYDLPVSASGSNNPLTLRGDKVFQGRLHRSLDGRYVTLAGYALPPGVADVDALGSPAIRVVGRVTATGVFDTTTTTTSYASTAPYVALTTDGTQFWLGGETLGLTHLMLGSSGPVTEISADSTLTPSIGLVRDIAFYDGGFAGVSTTAGARLFHYPAPLPTTLTAASTPAPTYAGLPAGIVAFKRSGAPDLLYVCEGTNGLQRWANEGGTWTMKLNLTTPCRGITGYEQAGKYVLLGVPPLTTTSDQVFMVVDDPASTTVPTPTTIATAPTNTQFRGLSLPPSP